MSLSICDFKVNYEKKLFFWLVSFSVYKTIQHLNNCVWFYFLVKETNQKDWLFVPLINDFSKNLNINPDAMYYCIKDPSQSIYIKYHFNQLSFYDYSDTSYYYLLTRSKTFDLLELGYKNYIPNLNNKYDYLNFYRSDYSYLLNSKFSLADEKMIYIFLEEYFEFYLKDHYFTAINFYKNNYNKAFSIGNNNNLKKDFIYFLKSSNKFSWLNFLDRKPFFLVNKTVEQPFGVPKIYPTRYWLDLVFEEFQTPKDWHCYRSIFFKGDRPRGWKTNPVWSEKEPGLSKPNRAFLPMITKPEHRFSDSHSCYDNYWWEYKTVCFDKPIYCYFTYKF